jgi:hypothetical protein
MGQTEIITNVGMRISVRETQCSRYSEVGEILFRQEESENLFGRGDSSTGL